MTVRPSILRVASLALAAAAMMTSQAKAADVHAIAFANHARVVFSDPVPPRLASQFSPGWMRLTFVYPDGSAVPLMPDDALTSVGGIIFALPVSHALSADGRYLVLDLTLFGTLDADEHGKPAITDRQYCPIVDTTNGCIIRNDTGAICGGEWDEEDGDLWHGLPGSGVAQSMKKQERPTANGVWTRYDNAHARNIQSYLDADALGLDNLKACDPPNAANRLAYARIEAELKRGTRDSRGTAPLDANQPATVSAARAPLFAQPAADSGHRGYLIRGDRIAIIGNADGGWLHMRYERPGKSPIEAWLQAGDVSR